MPSSAGSLRPVGGSSRVPVLLVVVALAMAAAFVVAPPHLAALGPGGGHAGESGLAAALREAFAGYWDSSERALSPGLERIADYWFRYHLVKAVTAAILVVVLAVLGVRLWTAFLRADRFRAGLASAGGAVMMLALFALALVMANVQGAVAPFASLLPLLAEGAAGGEFAGTWEQVRQGVAGSTATGGRAPAAVAVMVDDFARYHVAMAVIAGIVAVALTGVSVALWRGFAGARAYGRRARGLLAAGGTFFAAVALFVLLIAVANTATAADPGPALLNFVNGGW